VHRLATQSSQAQQLHELETACAAASGDLQKLHEESIGILQTELLQANNLLQQSATITEVEESKARLQAYHISQAEELASEAMQRERALRQTIEQHEQMQHTLEAAIAQMKEQSRGSGCS